MTAFSVTCLEISPKLRRQICAPLCGGPVCLLCNKLQGGEIRRHAKTGRSTLPSVIASIDISLHALSLLTHRDKSHLSKKAGWPWLSNIFLPFGQTQQLFFLRTGRRSLVLLPNLYIEKWQNANDNNSELNLCSVCDKWKVFVNKIWPNCKLVWVEDFWNWLLSR